MFSKTVFTLVSFLALSQFAMAIPTGEQIIPASQCGVGKLQCCQAVQSAADSQAVQQITGLLGLAAGTITGQAGLTCSSIIVIGLSGNSCNAQPVCCENNNFGGVLAGGCIPVNLDA